MDDSQVDFETIGDAVDIIEEGTDGIVLCVIGADSDGALWMIPRPAFDLDLMRQVFLAFGDSRWNAPKSR